MSSLNKITVLQRRHSGNGQVNNSLEHIMVTIHEYALYLL